MRKPLPDELFLHLSNPQLHPCYALLFFLGETVTNSPVSGCTNSIGWAHDLVSIRPSGDGNSFDRRGTAWTSLSPFMAARLARAIPPAVGTRDFVVTAGLPSPSHCSR